MKSLHSRLPCRASNRFTPAIVLWQHFVAPTRLALPALRLSSTAPSTAPSPAPTQTQDAPSPQDATLRVIRVNSRAGNIAGVKRNSIRSLPDQALAVEAIQNALHATKVAHNQGVDYEGVALEPMPAQYAVEDGKQSWALDEHEKTLPLLDRLALEMKRFYIVSRPSPREVLVRNRVIEQVGRDIRKVLPTYELELFGSEKTDLAFATSDLDLRLVSKTPSYEVLPAAKRFALLQKHKQSLYKVYNKRLLTNRRYLQPELRWARYPLIHFVDSQSNLAVDIVLTGDNRVAQEYIARYLNDHPYLPELYFVAKATLAIRGLTDVHRGGLGAYPLFMMLVASIKLNPHPRNDAAGALVNFLDFFNKFDVENQRISIDPPELSSKSDTSIMTQLTKQKIKKGKTKPLPSYMLSLRDPADPQNDLGRKAIVIKHIQAIFQKLANELNQADKTPTHATVLGRFVGPYDTNTKEHRSRLHQYGDRLHYRQKKALEYTAAQLEKQEKEKEKTKTKTEDTAAEETAEVVHSKAVVDEAVEVTEQDTTSDVEKRVPKQEL